MMQHPWWLSGMGQYHTDHGLIWHTRFWRPTKLVDITRPSVKWYLQFTRMTMEWAATYVSNEPLVICGSLRIYLELPGQHPFVLSYVCRRPWKNGAMVIYPIGNHGLIIIEGSLEVKLPTIWTVEKQRWEESEEKRSEERRCRCAKR